MIKPKEQKSSKRVTKPAKKRPTPRVEILDIEQDDLASFDALAMCNSPLVPNVL